MHKYDPILYGDQPPTAKPFRNRAQRRQRMRPVAEVTFRRDTQCAPHPMRGLGGNFARSSRPDVRAAWKRAVQAVARRDAGYAEAQADAWKGR